MRVTRLEALHQKFLKQMAVLDSSILTCALHTAAATGGGLWFQYRIRIIFCQIDSFNANLECLGLGLGCWTRRLGQVLADASISKLNPALACSRRVSRCPIAAPGVHTPPGVVWWSTSCARQIAASAIILAVDP